MQCHGHDFVMTGPASIQGGTVAQAGCSLRDLTLKVQITQARVHFLLLAIQEAADQLPVLPLCCLIGANSNPSPSTLTAVWPTWKAILMNLCGRLQPMGDWAA